MTFGTLMGAIDSSIINVALPQIQASLGVTVTEVTWVSTAYLISLSLIMPLTAWLGTRLGRKNVYQACLLIFTGASVLAGLSSSLSSLLAARFIQGAGAGALQPTEQAILRETFPVEEQGLAMGLYGLAVMVGPAVGPTFGGWLTDNFGWRWIFFINLPIGIIGWWMVRNNVPEPAYIRAQRTNIDGVGIGLLSVGLCSLLVMLEQGNQWDWFNSTAVWVLSGLAMACLASFIVWELWGTRTPAVDLRILKNASFAAGTTLGGMLGVVLFGALFLLPLFLEDVLGYDATMSGLALMPRSLVMLVMMPFTGLLYNALGPKVLIGSGFLVTSWSMYAMGQFTAASDPHQVLIPQVVSGLGFALIFVALSTTTLAGIPRERMSAATGLYNLVRQLGGSFGTAIFATMLENDTQRQHAYLAVNANLSHAPFQQFYGAMRSFFLSQGSAQASQQSLALVNGIVSQQASVLAFEHVFMLVAVLLLVPFPLLWLLKPAVRRSDAAPVLE
ncbi:MAG TPA: DHA2 family efflux MFS transporter permease subunit [Candidatus Xenobia bacterium]